MKLRPENMFYCCGALGHSNLYWALVSGVSLNPRFVQFRITLPPHKYNALQ